MKWSRKENNMIKNVKKYKQQKWTKMWQHTATTRFPGLFGPNRNEWQTCPTDFVSWERSRPTWPHRHPPVRQRVLSAPVSSLCTGSTGPGDLSQPNPAGHRSQTVHDWKGQSDRGGRRRQRPGAGDPPGADGHEGQLLQTEREALRWGKPAAVLKLKLMNCSTPPVSVSSVNV